MKVKEFIKELQKLKPSLQESDIFIECKNGLIVEPKIKIYIDALTHETKGIMIDK